MRKHFQRLAGVGAIAGLALGGLLIAPAGATPGYGPTNGYDWVRHGGSDTTYQMVDALATLWNEAAGCQLLDPTLHPAGPAYVLTNYPLDYFLFLAFLSDYYVLETDYGDRFEPLRGLPKRFDHGFPRYLYRFASSR